MGRTGRSRRTGAAARQARAEGLRARLVGALEALGAAAPGGARPDPPEEGAGWGADAPRWWRRLAQGAQAQPGWLQEVEALPAEAPRARVALLEALVEQDHPRVERHAMRRLLAATLEHRLGERAAASAQLHAALELDEGDAGAWRALEALDP